MANTIQIVDEEDADTADFLVCMRLTQPLILPDNMIDLCCKCGEAIQHRPHVPKAVKKACMPCIQPDAEKQAREGTLDVMISPDTAKDLADYFKKKMAN